MMHPAKMHPNSGNGMPVIDDHERGKLFVGGLSWETTQDNLQRYFSRYGEVIDCVVMKNNETGRSRGFGFVTFADPDNVDRALENGPHTLDGRTIDPKPCNPRSLHKPKRTGGYPKVFLGGLPPNVTETDLRNFFSRYGSVMEVVIMYDQEKKKSRGFGFLSFENDQAVDRACSEHFVNLNGKQVEIKKAEPRDGTTPGQMGGDYHWGSPQGPPMNGQMGGPPMGGGMPMGGGYQGGYQSWGSQQQGGYGGYNAGYGANNPSGWGAPPPQWNQYNAAPPHQNQGYAGYSDPYSSTAPSTGYGSGNWNYNNSGPASGIDMYSGPRSGLGAAPPNATAATGTPGTASKAGSDFSGYGAGGYSGYYQNSEPSNAYNARPRSAYGQGTESTQPPYPAF